MQGQSAGHATASAANRVTEHLRESCDSATECITNYPATSLLVTFGVGFGLGVLIGHIMAEPPRERTGLAGFGRNAWDTMSRYVPDAVSKRLGA